MNTPATQQSPQFSSTPEPQRSLPFGNQAPQVRGTVFFKKGLSPQAKFLFAALVDLSYLYKFGGNGRGEIVTSCARLAAILNHKRHSIAGWRDELLQAQVLRLRRQWPYPVWCLVGLCPGLNGEVDPRAFDAAWARGMNPHQPVPGEGEESVAAGFGGGVGGDGVPNATSWGQVRQDLASNAPERGDTDAIARRQEPLDEALTPPTCWRT